ncbi:hypothetical protein Patl1_02885 [Pistacia atlantica]|uniref:Uncharacterized protein n=1 Tax=Pistacia atlantica TaxID=434234 RepID=A0ACC1CD79_9ROSI|nr:hypothetical protein Patl1_02885 [Pistacia atlantica]
MASNQQAPGNQQPLVGSQQEGNLQPPNVLQPQQPSGVPSIMMNQPNLQSMPLSARQQTANMPLMGSLKPSNVPGLQTQQNPTNVQPFFPSQQTPANLQPNLGSQQNPTNVQPHQQHPAANVQQPHTASHQSPSNVHTQTGGHQTPGGNLQHYMGLQRPISGIMQPQLASKPPAANPLIQSAIKHGMGPTARGDRLMFSTSDDNVMLRQIQGTHVPDGREFNVKPLLDIVENIFKQAVPGVEAISAQELLAITDTDDKTYQTSFIGMLEALAYLIDRISCEITCKCSGGGDTHATAISILTMLSSFSWDAKLALALSAFAVTYGEFWLVAQSYTSNQLAKAVAILKQLPEILENTSVLKPQFDAIKNLIKAMVDVSKCIVEFRQLPTHYVTPDVEALSTAMAHIPVAVYWTIRSILACASQLTGLTLLGREHMVSTTEAWELSSLAHKLSNMHSHLLTQLQSCHKHIDEKKHLEAYQNLLHLFDMVHIDNMRIIKALIYQKDDLLPLVDGSTKRRVSLEVLKRKNVLLLISDLDISQEELSILEQIFTEARSHPTRQESQYEVVWLPILDPTINWTDAKQKQLETLQTAMPWYTVHHPSLIDRAVIKFIKDVWHFGKKPILVVLDPQGRVVSPNALHMMWIWGTLAFPFTTAREEALWKEETWRLELLVDGIDPTVVNWIVEGRHICLYGGEDIEWIRKFTTAANAVADAANISLGMVYVGKSNPKERVRRISATIVAEKLSYVMSGLTEIWYFWVRIESMWHSKNQLRRTVENDHIMSEIMTMLSYDGSEGGWAVFGKGSSEMIRAKGSTFLTCLQEHNAWKNEVPRKGFLPAMNDYLKQLYSPHHCSRLVLPGTAGMIPEKVVCSECGRIMERYIMYQCCDE